MNKKEIEELFAQVGAPPAHAVPKAVPAIDCTEVKMDPEWVGKIEAANYNPFIKIKEPPKPTPKQEWRMVGPDEELQDGDWWFDESNFGHITDSKIKIYGSKVSSWRFGWTINKMIAAKKEMPSKDKVFRKAPAGPRKLSGNRFFSKELPLP